MGNDKPRKRGRIDEYAKKYKKATFHAGKRPWSVDCDLAFPCATQNELSLDDAKTLTKNHVIAVAEGANMPSDADAVHYLLEKKVLFGPAKAARPGSSRWRKRPSPPSRTTCASAAWPRRRRCFSTATANA